MGTRASIQAAIERRLEQAVVRVASIAREKLIERTPVDTGNARAHWLQTIGKPADPATGLSPTVASAFADIVDYRLEDGSIFVSNYVPYIRRLKDGWSDQAPAGWVEQAVSEAVAEAAGGA